MKLFLRPDRVRNIVFSLLLFILSTQIHAATIESATSGNWNLSTTWIGGNIPAPGDNVVVKSGHSLSLSAPQSCAAVTIETGATMYLFGPITQSGAFVNNGTLNWTQGSFEGSETITNNGLMNVNTNGFAHNTNSGIINNGTLSWTG